MLVRYHVETLYTNVSMIPRGDSVQYVSMIPRGDSLQYVSMIPRGDSVQSMIPRVMKDER